MGRYTGFQGVLVPRPGGHLQGAMPAPIDTASERANCQRTSQLHVGACAHPWPPQVRAVWQVQAVNLMALNALAKQLSCAFDSFSIEHVAR